MNNTIKNYLGVVGTFAILIAGFAVWKYVDAYSKSIQPSSFRSFSVSGEGKVTAVPDVAAFTFTVIAQGGKDLATIQKDNALKMNAAIDFLKSEGIDAKDIKTETYNVEPRYQSYNCSSNGLYVCPPAEIVGYTITQTAQVRVRDFAKIGEVLSGVISKGVNNVSNLSFTIDDPTALENKAREKAVAQAKEKAMGVAKSAGFSLGKILSIYESGSGPIPYGMGYAGVSVSKGENYIPPTIESGSQNVQVNVTVQYEIE